MKGCVYCYEDFSANYNNNGGDPLNPTDINNSTPVIVNVKCSMCNDGFYEQNGTCLSRKACDDGFAFNKTSLECQ